MNHWSRDTFPAQGDDNRFDPLDQGSPGLSLSYLEVTYSLKGAFLPKASYYPKGTRDATFSLEILED